MNLNNLKPAWRRYCAYNSLEHMGEKEILLILDGAQGIAVTKTTRLLLNAAVFLLITICCQQG